MSKIKLFFIIIILSGPYRIEYVNAQNPSVSLSGTYIIDADSENGLYDTFVFDGAGKVTIHSFLEAQGDFFQIEDTIIVYPDKSTFIFILKDSMTLVGISTWVQDQVFRKMENDTVISPVTNRNSNYAALFYEYYLLTGRDAPDLSTYLNLNTDPDLNATMKRLCEDGFPRACITMANASMMNSPEIFSFLKDSSNDKKKASPNKNVLYYYAKAIEQNELSAISQLAAYFLMLGDKERALQLFEKGCEMGLQDCCFSIAALQFDLEGENE